MPSRCRCTTDKGRGGLHGCLHGADQTREGAAVDSSFGGVDLIYDRVVVVNTQDFRDRRNELVVIMGRARLW